MSEFNRDDSERWSHITLSTTREEAQDFRPTLSSFEEYGDAAARDRFYENEKEYIRQLQTQPTSEQKNLFFLTQQQDWHDSW